MLNRLIEALEFKLIANEKRAMLRHNLALFSHEVAWLRRYRVHARLVFFGTKWAAAEGAAVRRDATDDEIVCDKLSSSP
jgi:hypothetical protein